MDVGRTSSAGVPKTIEEATWRYIYHFRENYRGSPHEEYKLVNMTQALIRDLRKQAPNFYHNKLPMIVNQACTSMFLNDTSTESGLEGFCQKHTMFMAMLKDFKISQPSDDQPVNFNSELARLREKSDLMQQQTILQKQLEQLEAQEISSEDIGEEEFDNDYIRICDEMDKVREELQRVNFKIMLLDGTDTEQEVHFELHVKPRSILCRLSIEQLHNLECLMREHVQANSAKKTGLYLDLLMVDEMLAKIQINPDLFKKDELQQIAKDALGAYNDYFRKIEINFREENLEQLCSSAHLLPKEGVIISGPDDIPAEVKVKLDQHNKRCHQEMAEIVETFGERPCSEDTMGDQLEELDDGEDYRTKLEEDLRMKGIALKRVKEQPIDDCDPDDIMSSDEEDEPLNGTDYIPVAPVGESHIVTSDIATSATVTNGNPCVAMDCGQLVVNSDNQNDQQSNVYPANHKDDQEDHNDHNDHNEYENHHHDYYDDDDDDIQCLGIVEPNDKIKTVDLNE